MLSYTVKAETKNAMTTLAKFVYLYDALDFASFKASEASGWYHAKIVVYNSKNDSIWQTGDKPYDSQERVFAQVRKPASVSANADQPNDATVGEPFDTDGDPAKGHRC